MLRPLRIAVSVVSCICCVLVILLTVRSFTWADQTAVRISATYHIMITSQLGGLGFYLDDSPRVIRISRRIDELYANANGPRPQPWAHFSYPYGKYGFNIPHWFVALACGMLATVPWKPWRWRFSLRTLLLATTAVAAALGLIIYAVRG